MGTCSFRIEKAALVFMRKEHVPICVECVVLHVRGGWRNMRLRRALFTFVGIAIAIVLIIAGGVWAIGFNYVHITSAARPADFYRGESLGQSDDAGEQAALQKAILDGALEYVATFPAYRSRYYESGYPDDGYGVCTDVVAFALLHAGYDLQELVYTDYLAQPNAYDITEPDANIDFRRVRNLQVFFERNAQSLTTDLVDIDDWQGGDIAVFDGHIGIVSDRRRADGVPYLIHHANPFQLHYEEDALGSYDVVGHFRFQPVAS